MPLVSVIVPVYKTEDYLRRCLDSLVAQTLQDLEVIMVDDGSPDNCGRICDEYAEKYPNFLVVHKKNGGLTQARVSGLMVATGKYVTFVDSDDWLLPNMYAPMAQQAEEHNADMVAVGFTRDFGSRTEPFCNQFPSGVYEGERLNWLRENAPFDTVTMQQPLAPCVWAKLYRSESLLPILLNRTDTIGYGEDSLFTFPALFQCQRVVILNEHWEYQYQIREGSMTNAYYKNYFSDIYTVYDKMTEAAQPILTETLQRNIAHYYVFLYLNGVAQEVGKASPNKFSQKCRKLKEIAGDHRIVESLQYADLSCYSKNTATGLRLLADGRYRSYLAFHFTSRVLNKVKSLVKKAFG